MSSIFPTPDPELNAVLHELVTSVQKILSDNFVAAYLQGSFGVGDWDSDSDVDFTVVTEHEMSNEEISALQVMHARIFRMESGWAQHLEGSYFPKDLLRGDDPSKRKLWYLDNAHDRMVLSDHDNTRVVRWVVREHGIPLFGPDPKVLIDPVPADDLRQEVRSTMREWADEMYTGTYVIDNRWAQPFAVLSYCRMLHTLQTGRIESKLAGATWGKAALDPRWSGLIQRAWDERPNPSLKVTQPADPGDVKETLEFIHYALELSHSGRMEKL